MLVLSFSVFLAVHVVIRRAIFSSGHSEPHAEGPYLGVAASDG